MKMVGLKGMNMVGIRYYDDLNPWIDFVVYVPRGAEYMTAKKVHRVMDDWWNCKTESTCYGDALEDAFKDNVMMIVYHDSDDDYDEDYETAWEDMLANTEIAYTLEG